ncbi:MAG: ATP-dependent zinc metalloprotease FtsH [Kiritimatiellia bacterium]|jgi:cell division protease FtsH|nr:ATP-dependent zinc metalloprotease FtsH [Kiritimatiellia bacterium]
MKGQDSNKNSQGTPGEKGPQNLPVAQRRSILMWVVFFVVLLTIIHFMTTRQQAYKEIPFNPDFIAKVAEGKIQKCVIVNEVSGEDHIRGEIIELDPATDSVNTIRFKVNIASADEDIRKLLVDNNVEFSILHQNPYFLQIVSSILPVLLIFGILYFFFMRQMKSAGHGALSFGKSRARILARDKNKVTFENVAGIDEAKEEVQEIIAFLKDPKKFQKLGGRIPKGVLLMGPPGTGKTLLAKAIAGEADVPFFSISGSDFVEMFVGVGASRVRDMFEQGKKSAPCIIFIDEIDAVGRSRFTGIGGGHDEREQTLNALLVEMDGFETQEGVIILAATNRPDVLDQALLRPGRFDRQVVIDLPMIDGREAILDMHAKAITLAKDITLRKIARGTPGFSGADLENLLNEAALCAARQGKDAVEIVDLEEARDKVMWGRERRSRVMDEKEKRNTAYHEAGHALVQQVVEGTEPLHKVTIIPRGMYMGATMSLPEKDRYSTSKSQLLGELSLCMGGRAAEEIVFGDITNGAYGDIKHATRLARNMVCNWGMSDELGPQSYGENQELMFLGREVSRSQDYSEDTARRIDTEVSRLLMTAHATAVDILTRERAKLDMIAERLLEHETIDGRDVEEIVEHGRVLSEEEREVIDRKKKEEEESTDTTDEVAGTAGSPGKEPEPHKAPEEPPMSWPGREKEDEEQA